MSSGHHPRENWPTFSTTKPITATEIAAEFSHHDLTIARINNGSFGSCPQSIISAQQQYQLQFLQQPDYFYFNTLKSSMLKSRTVIQSLVNAADVKEISIVDNATTAASIVLQHVTRSFHPGDAAVILHYAYGSVKKAVYAYFARAGGKVIEVQLPFPVNSNEEIVTEFDKALKMGRDKGGKIRLAVIDHITSMPSVVIPVKELVQMCREEQVDIIFVDGAHAIGNVDVDVRDVGADFYTSNLHKWFFTPPSAAFLYCRSDKVLDLHHPVVSIESCWIGTRDYSAQLVIPEVMELFVNRFEGGIEGIRKRNCDMVVEMAEMLVEAWGTELGTPRGMCSSMAMVGMPACLGISTNSDALNLRTHLRVAFKVEVPIYYRAPLEGEVNPITGYARISHQVYNTIEHYYSFRDAIIKLVNDGFTCAILEN
ncbi:unnamed protein product [Withania somnifera]